MVNLQIKLWVARIAQNFMYLIIDEYAGLLPRDCSFNDAAPVEEVNKLGT